MIKFSACNPIEKRYSTTLSSIVLGEFNCSYTFYFYSCTTEKKMNVFWRFDDIVIKYICMGLYEMKQGSIPKIKTDIEFRFLILTV